MLAPLFDWASAHTDPMIVILLSLYALPTVRLILITLLPDEEEK